MTAPLRLTVRRSEVAVPTGLAAEISLQLPSEVVWIEEAVELIARHGEDPTKMVQVRVECLVEQVRLHVTDQGNGFNPHQIPEPVHPDDLENACGRGLFLIYNLMDQVRFNDRGNSICMTLRRH
jgi:anti-sigma regulatory factor (Ser/Thr protein kinase)